MGVLDTCKTEEDPFKNEGARVVIKNLPLYVYAEFFFDAQGELNQRLR